MSLALTPGQTFTHARYLDPTWTPAPGQRQSDAPKARCTITRATPTTVYFGYAGTGKGGFRQARDTFEATYPTLEPAATTELRAWIQANTGCDPTAAEHAAVFAFSTTEPCTGCGAVTDTALLALEDDTAERLCFACASA